MSRQDGFQLLKAPSPEPQLDILRGHESPASKPDRLYPEFCYPGGAGDVAFSTTLFTTLYEEEELRERHYCNEEFSKSAPLSENPCEEGDSLTQPTIYYVLRLFDSIRGYHQVRTFCYHGSAPIRHSFNGLGLSRLVRPSLCGKLYLIITRDCQFIQGHRDITSC